jgi:4-aminobutyrate aminotransferase/(S)-3-amino-2-methylpropionate transaminase
MRREIKMKKTSIKTITEIPGEKSRRLKEIAERYVASGSMYSMFPIMAAEAKGAIIKDVDGNSYIDFYAGVGVLNLGHGHPKVVEAAKAQAEMLVHTCFGSVMHEPFIRIAERLSKITPGKFPKATALFNSGSEAIENSIKIARAHTKRPAVICFDYAFHGKTLLATSLDGTVKPLKAGYGPFFPEIYRFPVAYCYRCPFGLSYPDCSMRCLEFIKQGFLTTVDPEQVAALVIEPVIGEGGYIFPPKEFLPGLQEICREHGIVFVLDEVQSGFGRTGKMFACEHWGVAPDLMVMSKSIANGFPLSAVTGRKEIMNAAGILGGTFVGHPVSCAAALAVLNTFEEERILQKAQSMAEIMRSRLRKMYQRIPLIGDLRGIDVAWGIELVRDRKAKEPATEETKRVLNECLRNGLIAIKAGVYGNVIRIIPPLVITEEQLNEGFDILEETLIRVSG